MRSFDFAKYLSDAEFQADVYNASSNPNGFGFAVPPYHQDWIELQGPGSGFGGVGQAVRYTWKRLGTCSSTAIQYDMALPQPYQHEVWLEYYERFSTSPRFETVVGGLPPGPGCTSAPDYKYLHFYTSGSKRFPLDIGQFTGHDSHIYLPPNGKSLWAGRGRPGVQWDDITDGAWHQVRVHWRLPSGASSADGFVQIGFNGIAVGNVAGFAGWDTGSLEAPFRSIAFGRNNNQGPNSAHVGMWREVSSIKLYYSNPRWTWR